MWEHLLFSDRCNVQMTNESWSSERMWPGLPKLDSKSNHPRFRTHHALRRKSDLHVECQAALLAEDAKGFAALGRAPFAAFALQAGGRQSQAPQLSEPKVGVGHEGQPRLGAVCLKCIIARGRKVDKRYVQQLAWCWV